MAVGITAYRGLKSYRWIAAGWLLHTAWDVLHHELGLPLVSCLPTSSFAVTDAILAAWFLLGAPGALGARRAAAAFSTTSGGGVTSKLAHPRS